MTKVSSLEILSLLMIQLAEVNAARCHTNVESNPAIADEMFKKIKIDIGFIKDIFVRLERWEKNVQDELGVIAKHLDDYKENEDIEEEFGLIKLQTVEQMVSNLKADITPLLQLPSATGSITTSSSISTMRTLPTPVISGTRTSVPQLYENFEHQLRIRPINLLSLSIFPANAVIKKRMLICWWTGQDLALPRRLKTADEDGERILNEFVGRDLITPINRAHSSSLDSFQVPTVIRDKLILYAMKAKLYPAHYYSIHLRMFEPASAEQEVAAEAGDQNPDQLLTCININRRYLKFKKSEFIRMRRIIVLHLGRLQVHSAENQHIEVDNTEFLDWLGSHFHSLRYLSLQGISRIMELPPSIGKLSNLTILDLRACHNLERLPAEITMLSSLTHLDVSECYLIDHMPEGLGSLSKLQVLKGFVIGNFRSPDQCRLEELSRLKKLRKLTISIRCDSLTAEGELGELRSFTALRSLTIRWGRGISQSERGKLPEQVRDAVNMTIATGVITPPYLEKLDLSCFPGRNAPVWLNPWALRKLKKLHIRGGMLCNLGEHRGKWSVEVLRLRFLNEFVVCESELLKSFPVLAYLEIHECSKLMSTTRRWGNISPQ